MNLFKRFLVTCLIIFGQQTYAQAILPANNPDASTNALIEICANQNDQDAQNFCYGFGEGVYQAYLANRSSKAKQSICFTQTSGTREMILQDFLKWNKVNPQFGQELAAKTLMRFFTQQYPCK